MEAGMKRNILLSGAAAIALGLVGWGSVASAAEIDVGWASSTTGLIKAASTFAFGAGIGWTNTATTAGSPNTVLNTQGQAQATNGLGLTNPGVEDSNTLDTLSVTVPAGNCSVVCSGTIVLFVTASGLTYPSPGPTEWQIGFSTSNDPATFSDTMSVLIDSNDAKNYTGVAANAVVGGSVASIATSGPLTGTSSVAKFPATTLTTPYSITEEYVISFTGPGNLTDQIAVTSADNLIPEPASLSLLGGGLLAFGAWRRRRSDKR
jgi:hypothetical protein